MSKKKRKVTYKKIYLDWIDYTIYVYFTSDPKYTRNVYLVKKFNMAPYEGDWIACHTSWGASSWITLPLKPSIDLIIHEISHAVDTIIAYYGFEGQEIRAYLLGYLTKLLIK